MRAFITGIGGFAGSHLAEFLLENTDWEISGLIHRSPGNAEHLKNRVRLERGDLGNYQSIEEILARIRPHYIFHLAAMAFVPDSWRDPWGVFENNVRGQLNVLQAVVNIKLDSCILVVGSNEEYGIIPEEDLPVREDTPLRPNNPYGVSKVAQDFLGLQFHLSHGLYVVRVRPFNHTGPRQRPDFVIPAFAKQLAEAEAGLRPPVIKVGNLSPRRDFTDVRDVVRAYYLALTKGKPGEVYNVGSGKAYSIKEVLDMLLKMCPIEVKVEQDPALMRPSDVPVTLCDYSKLKRDTGWEPSIPLEKTLEDIMDYWRKKVKEGE
ncbi:MAG: GDP-mannose 4,6-dehydratase [Anaerolineae bacterium]|nr:GDP-mannose 4,6-dehydratase [Anaerolineae bacterium]MDW8102384.1 GDP-mannose 4,6-dehydratase [Anaerolineae bacterium]